MQPVPDPYRALGVARGATEAEIKAAHRKLAKRYHPDASGGDTRRLLAVQEAYKVLSDPLQRRDWDARHSGPVRASQPAATKPRAPKAARKPSAATTRARAASAETDAPPNDPAAAPAAGPGRPRSSRAYTWSASEVPWWEEGAARDKQRARARRRATGPAQDAAGTNPAASTNAPDFEVYNRSSGAAWSMAARAYFRRGDQELPSRGSFHHQGTQPLTAARARAAAEAEARQQAARAAREQPPATQRAAAQPAPGAYVYANAGVARDPETVSHAREQFLKRIRAQHWPNIKERMLYSLAAWAPVAALIGFGGSLGTGCDPGALGCPPQLELIQAALIGAALLAFVFVPKAAYFAAIGTLGMLLTAAVSVAVVAFLDVPLPLSIELVAMVGILLIVAYIASAGFALLRGGPWKVAQQ